MEIRTALSAARPARPGASPRPTASVDPASVADDVLLAGPDAPMRAPGPATLRSLTSASEAPPDRDRLAAVARLVDSAGNLRKHDRDYRLQAWSQGGDGTLYAAYTDRKSGVASYLAAVAPTGEIRWELPVEKGPIRQVAGLDDGVLLWTRESRSCCTAEGKVLADTDAPPDMGDLWQDASGCRYHTQGPARNLRIETADSRSVAIPVELATAEVISGRPTPDGGLLVRTRDRVVQFAPGGAVAHSTPLPTWSESGRDGFAVQDAQALPNGDLLLVRQKTSVYYPKFGPGNHHMGPMFFIRPDFDALPEPIITTSDALVRLSPDGKVKWDTGFLGSGMRPVVTSDGQVLVPSPKYEDQGKLVQRVQEDGTLASAFQVEEPIRDVQALDGGLVLVSHGDGATVRTPDGQVRGRVDLGGESKDRRFQGQDREGRLLYWDDGSRELWACDAANPDPAARWTRLTDPLGDHSLKLAMANPDRPADGLPRLEEGENWVVIGGVRLPIQSRMVN